MHKGLEEVGINNKLNIKKTQLLDKYINEEVKEVSIDYIISANDEWNYFSKLSDEKLSELMLSIKQVGLLNPVILWDNGTGDTEGLYTCLSGHNRLIAYRNLYQMTGDSKYENILAIVKSKDSIDENIAKQIIIDANLAQRELSKAEKTQSIIKKFSLLKEREDEVEVTEFSKLLESEFGIKSRQIRRYRKLGELIQEFQDMINENKIKIETGCQIARLSPKLQEFLYDELNKDKKRLSIINKKSSEIQSYFTEKDIENLFIEVKENKNTEGLIEITYLDNDNKTICAKLSYLKEDEKSFIALLESTIKANENIGIKYTITK